ncbi:hypothetical protein SCUCBS95973_002016 [Sporothrix curviconia]|uniref:Phosphatidylethanolamine-binding protein n=1 Tax=Sporothrix curviconia TaxID=1260050 RepID=A0ABP0B481_9PEZI
MADRFAPVLAALTAIGGADAAAPNPTAATSASSPATLRLTFAQPEGKPPVVVGADNAGTAVTPLEAKDEPALALAASFARSLAPGQKLLAVSLDPDAPFPSFAFLGPILHGLQTDLVVAGAADGGSGSSSSSGWVPLTSPTKPIVSYIKPGPPSPSAAHRYVFMVYKQPEGLDTAGVMARMGWAPEGVSRMGRMRFDANTLTQNLGLGEIVAINYFRSQQ